MAYSFKLGNSTRILIHLKRRIIMKKRIRALQPSRMFVVAVILLCGSLLSVAFWSPSASPQQKTKNIKQETQHYPGPILDYDTYNLSALTESKERELRRARSSRYDDREPWPLGNFPAEMTEYSISSHWEIGLPALPTAQSDAIILGDVINAQAYLSNDKSGVYSEFIINVRQIFKDYIGESLKPDAILIAEREGGVARFQNGRILRYKVWKQGLPRPGSKYVFFLKRNEQGQDYLIITAYELRNGHVFPLDGADIKEEDGKLQFAVYEGSVEERFLDAMRQAIINPPKVPRSFIRNLDEDRHNPSKRRPNE